MAAEFPPALCHTLRQHGQGALLDQAARWPEHARRGFRFEADLIDWELVDRLYRSAITGSESSVDDPRTLAQRATPPSG